MTGTLLDIRHLEQGVIHNNRLPFCQCRTNIANQLGRIIDGAYGQSHNPMANTVIPGM